MKHLLTSHITETSGLIVGPDTLQFLQSSYKEILLSLAAGMRYDSASPMVIAGLDISQSGGVYNIAPGAVLYSNEIYLTPAFSAPSLSDVWLYEHVGYASWDPVAFTDGTMHNVHQDKILLVQIGTPTEAVRFPLSDLVYLPDQLRKKMQAPRHVRIPIGEWDMNTSETKSVSFGFNIDLDKVSNVSHVIVGNNDRVYPPTYNGSVSSWINIIHPSSAFMVSSQGGNPNFSGTGRNRGWIDITLV